MIGFRHGLLALALCLVPILEARVAAQNPPGPTLTPPALDVVSYEATSEGPYEFVVQGPPGVWTYVLARTWLPLDPNNPDPVAEALVDTYDLRFWSWMPNASGIGTSVPPAAIVGNDPLSQEPALVTAVYDRAVMATRPNAVRSMFQPILTAGSQSSTAVPLVWSVYCEPWLTWARKGPASAFQMWIDRLASPCDFPGDEQQTLENNSWFSLEHVVTTCVADQTGDSVLAAHFMDEDYDLAIARGLRVSFQPIAIADASYTSLIPTNNPLTVVPLPGMSGTPPIPPTLLIGGTTTVQVHSRDPMTGGGPGHTFNGVPFGPVAMAGGSLQMPLAGMIPPLSTSIHVGTSVFVLQGHFAHAGVAAFPLPASIAAGTGISILSITNGCGTTTGSGQAWQQVVVHDPINPTGM